MWSGPRPEGGSRSRAWRRSWRFATPEQQDWWDGLDDEQRWAISVTASTEPAATPQDAAVHAQILEFHDRAILQTPRWALVVSAVALAGLVVLGVAVDDPVLLYLVASGAPSVWVGLARRRDRWERIDELRSAALAAGVPCTPRGLDTDVGERR